MKSKTLAVLSFFLVMMIFTPCQSQLLQGSEQDKGEKFFFREAYITLADYTDGEEVITEKIAINLEKGGLSGMVNFSGYDDLLHLKDINLTLMEDAEIEITAASPGRSALWTGNDFLDVIENTGAKQQLEKGENNLDIIHLLGELDNPKEDISLGYLREIAGDLIVLEGILSAGEENEDYTINLIIILNKPGFGDVTYENSIAVSDAIMVLRKIVGLAELDAGQKIIADVNADGSLSVSDAILILRKIVGLTDSFPVEGPLAFQSLSLSAISRTFLFGNVIDERTLRIPVSLSSDGLEGQLTLPLGESSLLDRFVTFELDGGSVEVNKKSTFTLINIITGETAEWSSEDLMLEIEEYDKSEGFNKGINTYKIEDYIDELESDDTEEIDTARIKELLGKEIIVEGILFSRYGDREKVSLTVSFELNN